MRVRAVGAMAALGRLAVLGAGNCLWKLPARLSAGLQGCRPRRGYSEGRAEVRTRGLGTGRRAGRWGGLCRAALPETVSL